MINPLGNTVFRVSLHPVRAHPSSLSSSEVEWGWGVGAGAGRLRTGSPFICFPVRTLSHDPPCGNLSRTQWEVVRLVLSEKSHP